MFFHFNFAPLIFINFHQGAKSEDEFIPPCNVLNLCTELLQSSISSFVPPFRLLFIHPGIKINSRVTLDGTGSSRRQYGILAFVNQKYIRFVNS